MPPNAPDPAPQGPRDAARREDAAAAAAAPLLHVVVGVFIHGGRSGRGAGWRIRRVVHARTRRIRLLLVHVQEVVDVVLRHGDVFVAGEDAVVHRMERSLHSSLRTGRPPLRTGRPPLYEPDVRRYEPDVRRFLFARALACGGRA
ncbi:MAG: hypothetical protein CMF70_06770 [Magnetovibrio sp.]|nr:hypothetical protein [Magnetovibrio sp.]